MAEQRLSRNQRRAQLLAAATEIIQTQGSNALTLVTLAEHAGVSRPVTYDHFTTREGLLLALYQDYDTSLIQAMRDARAQATSPESAIKALVTAYIDGLRAAGPECAQIQAALSGHPHTSHYREESERAYQDELHAALALPPPLCRGLFHALDGLARAAATGHLSRTKAITAATTIMLATLERAQAG